MKKTDGTEKLSVRREALRELTTQDLTLVAGGTTGSGGRNTV